MSGFCHLHLHTEYSLLEGACRISGLGEALQRVGQTSAAITDRASMSGCVAFYRACKAAGIHPVIGCELKVSCTEGQSGWMVLLCENAEGYANLCHLLSVFCTSPDVPGRALLPDQLRGRTAGLFALSGGPEGEIFSLLERGDTVAAEKTARLLADLFGAGRFFIELQNHGLTSERRLLADQFALAGRLGLGCVATNAVQYYRREDAALCRALCCIRQGVTLAEGAGPATDEYYLKSGDEMSALLGGFDGAVENAAALAERCRFDFDFETRRLPSFPVPEGTDAGELLRRQTFEGMERLAAAGKIPAAGHTPEEYRERAEYELSVIAGMGFCDYFLIVADYVGFAKRSGIPVGPGRGSGAGSIVAYFTGITEVDPLRFDLYFERFLNPERVSMPDIDIDFDFSRRDEVLAYVRRRYGADRVAQIITFGTMAARAALRDACRLHGLGVPGTDRIMLLLPREEMPLSEAVKTPRLKEAIAADASVREVFDTACMLEGLPRNLSVHAAGVIITDLPVSAYLPLTVSGDTVISQYDMDTVASLGLLKFDFLALRYLTVTDAAEKAIRADFPEFDPQNLPWDDRKTFRMLSAGRTVGVFQLESDGITSMVKRLKPESLGDLVDTIALYRPGPMDSIPVYIRGRQNPASIRYPHPLLEPVLRSTRGCIVYQEQVMSIFRILAGYTAGHADIVRRAMAKKKAAALEAERGTFIAGAAQKGMTEAAAGALFDSMSAFAGYAFNLSHAVAYGMITYRTACLKANYPTYYLTALMNVSASPEKMPMYASELASFGCSVLPPDVNRSGAEFRAEKDGIRYGLAYMKGVGLPFAQAAAAEAARSPFASLHDFVERMPQRAFQRRACETLILAGAFAFTGLTRAGLLALLETELAARAESLRGGVEGQMDIFSLGADTDSAAQAPLPEAVLRLPEFPEEELARAEKEICGLVFSRSTSAASNRTADPARRENRAATAGRESQAAAPARRENRAAAAGRESLAADPAACAPKTPQAAPAALQTPAEAEPAVPGPAAPGAAAKPSGGAPVVFVRVPSRASAECRRCENLAEIFDGPVPLVFYYADTGEYRPYPHGIDRTPGILGFFGEAAGKDSVISRN